MNKNKMEKVNMENCKMGAKVMLAFPGPYSALSISESNPVMGTSFECPGTIRFFKRTFYRTDGIIIGVEWGNGKSSYYIENELVFVDGSEVNKSTGYFSIWD